MNHSANEIIAASDGIVQFPNGNVFVEQAIDLKDGVIYQGTGSHMPNAASSQRGTAFKPATGYTGRCFTGRASNGYMRDFRIDGFEDNGIHFDKSSSAYGIDNVSVLRCGGDGLHIVSAIGMNIGSLTLYSNAGHGMFMGDGSVSIQMLTGDNNKTLLTSDSISTSFINLMSFWAERTVATGHDKIFEFKKRGRVNIGCGNVYISGGLPQADSWIVAHDNIFLDVGGITANRYDGYQYGFRSLSRYIDTSKYFEIKR